MIERHPEPAPDEFAGILDRRLEAHIIDILLLIIVAGGSLSLIGTVTGAFGLLGGLAIIAILPVVFPLYIVYSAAMEVVYGRTLGKAARGLVVVSEDGSRPGAGGAVLRNVLLVVDVLPIAYLVGIASAFVSDRNQRVGDRVGGTTVMTTA